MKTIFRSMIVLGLVAFSINGFAFQNEPDGFRDTKWGTHFNLFKDMIPNKYVDNTYSLSNDNMAIEGAKTTGIYYVFCENQLCQVDAYLLDYKNFDILKKAFFRKFGEPDSNVDPNHYEIYKWGNHKRGKTYIFLKYDSGEGILKLSSPKLRNELEKEARAIDKQEQVLLDNKFKKYLTEEWQKQDKDPMIACLNSKSHLVPKKVKEVALTYGLDTWEIIVKHVADDEIMRSFQDVVSLCIKEIEESKQLQSSISNCDSEPRYKNGEPTFNVCNDETKKTSIQSIVSTLSDTEKEKLKESLIALYTVGALAGLSQNVDEEEAIKLIDKKIDGKTAKEIIQTAEELKQYIKDNK